jgi:hypothetical protein
VDFESFTFTTDRLLARERFQQVIADLPTWDDPTLKSFGLTRHNWSSLALISMGFERPFLAGFGIVRFSMPYQYLEDIATADVAFQA